MHKVQMVGWALLAGTYALWALSGSQRRDEDNGEAQYLGGIERLTMEIQQLSTLVERLEDEVEAQTLVPPAPSPAVQTTEATLATDALLARLDQLEELARQVLSRPIDREGSRDSDEDWADFAASARGAEALSAYQGAMRDTGASIDARLDALEMLARFPHAMNAIAPLLADVKDLFGQVDSESKRVKVVEALDGCVDAAAIDWLAALIADVAQNELRVRREASKALRKGASDPQVRAIAQQLLENEPDPDVRTELLRIIEG